jgi:hypothetical protein
VSASHFEIDVSSLPRNPAYGLGVTERRIDLERSGRACTAHLVDSFHEMLCEVRSDGERVIDAAGSFRRYPTSICPGAATELRQLIGMPLDRAERRHLGTARARRHCTHLLDLALLAVRHLTRTATHRRYEARVPDGRDEPVPLTVLRDGAVVLQWVGRDGVLLDPPRLAGLSLRQGFGRWAAEKLDAETHEAATILARTVLIARGREFDVRAWAGRPIGPRRGPVDVCYAYSAARSETGEFLGTNGLDATVDR